MKIRTEALSKHQYSIYQGTDGKWRTHLPDHTKAENRRLIKRKTKQSIEDAIVEFYSTDSTPQKSLADIYPEWLDYYQVKAASSNTTRRTTYVWKRYYADDPITNVPLCELSFIELDKWIHQKVKQYDMTKTQFYNFSLPMRQIYAYATAKEYIKKNIFLDVHVDSKHFKKKRKQSNQSQVYSEEEEKLIIKEAWKDYKENSNDATPLSIIFLFYTGVRIGELVAFMDLDVNGNYIYVNRTLVRLSSSSNGTDYSYDGRTVVDHAKSDAGLRRIYLTSEARVVVDEARKSSYMSGFKSGFWLFMHDGKPIRENALRKRLRKYCTALGIEYRSPHKIRKTYISTLIDAGININRIREMVGHEDERTTYRSYCFDRKTDYEANEQLEAALQVSSGIQN